MNQPDDLIATLADIDPDSELAHARQTRHAATKHAQGSYTLLFSQGDEDFPLAERRLLAAQVAGWHAQPGLQAHYQPQESLAGSVRINAAQAFAHRLTFDGGAAESFRLDGGRQHDVGNHQQRGNVKALADEFDFAFKPVFFHQFFQFFGIFDAPLVGTDDEAEKVAVFQFGKGFEQFPADDAVSFDEGPELPEGEAVADDFARCGDGSCPRPAIDQGNFTEVIAGAERGHVDAAN